MMHYFLYWEKEKVGIIILLFSFSEEVRRTLSLCFIPGATGMLRHAISVCDFSHTLTDWKTWHLQALLTHTHTELTYCATASSFPTPVLLPLILSILSSEMMISEQTTFSHNEKEWGRRGENDTDCYSQEKGPCSHFTPAPYTPATYMPSFDTLWHYIL